MESNRLMPISVRTANNLLKGFGEGAGGIVAEGLRDFGDGIASWNRRIFL
jgi:hypothetical protein